MDDIERGATWMKGNLDLVSCVEVLSPVLSEVKLSGNRRDPDPWRPGTVLVWKTHFPQSRSVFTEGHIVAYGMHISWDFTYHVSRQCHDRHHSHHHHLMRQCELTICYVTLITATALYHHWRFISVGQMTNQSPCCVLPQALTKTINTHLICTRTHTHSGIYELAEDEKIQMLHSPWNNFVCAKNIETCCAPA